MAMMVDIDTVVAGGRPQTLDYLPTRFVGNGRKDELYCRCHKLWTLVSLCLISVFHVFIFKLASCLQLEQQKAAKGTREVKQKSSFHVLACHAI
jgi:hypothetical protein